jgi:hypothetical protein
MNTSNKTTANEDVKISVKMKLSALWVALMLIYIYADILSNFKPGAIEKMMDGFMGPFPVTQGGLLSASILMMIPAVMVFLSLTVRVQDIVNSFECPFYLDEGSGHREQSQAIW